LKADGFRHHLFGLRERLTRRSHGVNFSQPLLQRQQSAIKLEDLAPGQTARRLMIGPVFHVVAPSN
jgi:hypothetical protein